MDDRLIELYVQRGRLRERISTQRELVARELAPLATALGFAHQGMVWCRRAKAYVQAHPAVVTAVVVAVLVWRPRWVLRAVRWGFVGWRGWRAWRTRGRQVSELFRAFRGTADRP